MVMKIERLGCTHRCFEHICSLITPYEVVWNNNNDGVPPENYTVPLLDKDGNNDIDKAISNWTSEKKRVA